MGGGHSGECLRPGIEAIAAEQLFHRLPFGLQEPIQYSTGYGLTESCFAREAVYIGAQALAAAGIDIQGRSEIECSLGGGVRRQPNTSVGAWH